MSQSDDPPPIEIGPKSLFCWPVFWLLLGFSVFNFAAMPVGVVLSPQSEWLTGGLAFGVMPAEILVLATWLVWAKGSFLRRLANHWAIGTGLFACWAIGCLVIPRIRDFGPDALEVLCAALLALFPVSLACQLPLWTLRNYLGWRIVNSRSPVSRPLSIGDILAGTAVVALAIAAIQFVVGRTDRESIAWIAWGIGLASAALISLLSVPVALTLLLRNFPLKIGVSAVAGYACLATMVTVAIVWLPAAITERLSLLAAIVTLMSSFTATLTLALLIARSQGYRLLIGRESPPIPPTSDL